MPGWLYFHTKTVDHPTQHTHTHTLDQLFLTNNLKQHKIARQKQQHKTITSKTTTKKQYQNNTLIISIHPKDKSHNQFEIYIYITQPS